MTSNDGIAVLLQVFAALGSVVCSLLGLVVFAVGAWFFVRRMGVPGSTIDTTGLQAMYSQTLGYRSIPTHDPQRTHMVREVGGDEVHLETHTTQSGAGLRVSYAWSTPRPSNCALHVVERTVADGLTRALRDSMRGRERDFAPAWPTAFATGDAQLDARFRVFAPSAEHAQAALALREALLALSYVELRADAQGVHLSDPFQENLLARMGGPMGMARIAEPSGIAAQVTLHEQAAALVLAAARQP